MLASNKVSALSAAILSAAMRATARVAPVSAIWRAGFFIDDLAPKRLQLGKETSVAGQAPSGEAARRPRENLHQALDR
jgi:hypothetical protein